MGAITQDRNTTIAGELGRRASTVPLSISVTGAAKASYGLQMVKDRILSPFLLQMVVFSAIDATESQLGQNTFAVTGAIEFEDGVLPLKLDNMYAGDFNLPAQVSLAAAIPLAYVMQSGFDALRLKRIALNLEAFPEKRQLQIEQVWSSRREVRPGDEVDLTVVMTGENGAEIVRKASYRLPIGTAPGPLHFTVADANTINMTEFRQLISSPPKSPVQLISFMNALRTSTSAYLRIWRAQPAYDVEGATLPDPPPSLAMILARTQPSLSALPAQANAKMAEIRIDAGNMVVTGSRSIQLEVKE
jgi:hypothetical protein